MCEIKGAIGNIFMGKPVSSHTHPTNTDASSYPGDKLTAKQGMKGLWEARASLRFIFAIRIILEIYEFSDNWGLLSASHVGWHLAWTVAAPRDTGIMTIFLSH